MSFFEEVGLSKLEDHWPVLITSACVWHLVWMAGWRASDAFLPKFKTFNWKQKSDWAMRSVSFSHATIISALAIPLLLDTDLQKDPVFGYKHSAGNVYAITCGYFVWDTVYSLWEGNLGFIIHGVACFIVFILSFRPFLQYYGGVFLLFELSTPFLNIHYFCDKFGYSGTMLQMINGIILLAVFFGARLVFGFYSSYNFFVDVTRNMDKIPFYIVAIYFSLNVVLNSLNVYWFYKMILSIRKRFKPKSKTKKTN
ncbi:hypothetical protein HDU97_002569 [Phlyctochytrium planicorne]|nr:hypothetical protein HDU97_002569 [Phlyctochytrium planicorne]